jgi:transcriptional regulator with XRE-family HTH domain
LVLSTTKYNTVQQRQPARVLGSDLVARKRPVFHPALGTFFKELRESRGWSLRGAASLAGRRELALTYQVLFRLEQGQVKNPEPEVMRAIASLYGLDYSDVVSRFIAMRYDLPGHSLDQQSAPGGADVPASDVRRSGSNLATAEPEATPGHGPTHADDPTRAADLARLTERFREEIDARAGASPIAVEDGVRAAHAILSELVERLDAAPARRRTAGRNRR